MDPYNTNDGMVCGIERSGGSLPFLFLQRIQGINGNE